MINSFAAGHSRAGPFHAWEFHHVNAMACKRTRKRPRWSTRERCFNWPRASRPALLLAASHKIPPPRADDLSTDRLFEAVDPGLLHAESHLILKRGHPSKSARQIEGRLNRPDGL